MHINMSDTMMISTRKSAGRARQYAASFVAGLGALISIWPQGPAPRYPHASATDALRRDGVQIGRDMSRVIERENRRVKAQQD